MRAKTTTNAILLSFVTAASMGCSKDDSPSEPAPPPRQLEYTFGRHASYPEEITVLWGDKELGTLSRGPETLKAELPDGVWLSDPQRPLTGRVKTTCGVQVFPLYDPNIDSRDSEKRWRESAGEEPISVHLMIEKGVRLVDAWMDNPFEGELVKYKVGTAELEAKFTKVIIGKQEELVKSPGGSHELLIGDCEGADEVSLGERKLGKLSGAKRNDKGFEQYVVDLEGGHCYRAKTYVYTMSGLGESPEDVLLQAQGSVSPIMLDEFDYFLSEPPSTLEGQLGDGELRRVSIERCPCTEG